MKTLRYAISAVIIACLFWWVGAAETLAVFRELHWRYVGVLILFSFVLIWASSMKWQVFARAMGYNEPLPRLMKLYAMGYFFNFFTPAQVAGDVMRSLHLDSGGGRRGDALVATFLERLTGLLSMALLGVFAVIIGSPAAAGLEMAVLGVAAFSLSGTAVCFYDVLRNPVFRLIEKMSLRFLPEKFSLKIHSLLGKIEASMRLAQRSPYLLAKGLFWAFLFHILSVGNACVAGMAVGWEQPPILGFFVVIPLVLLVGTIPITPSGIGLQEGAFVFLLQRIGATRGQAFGLAILLRAKVVLIAIVGAFFWLALRREKERRERERGAENYSNLTASTETL